MINKENCVTINILITKKIGKSLISTISNTNCFGCFRKLNPLSLKSSILCTAIECVALAALGGWIGFYFHPHYTSYIGIGILSGSIILNNSLFLFINRQNIFFGGYPLQKQLEVDKNKYGAEIIGLQIDNKTCYFYGAFINPLHVEWQKNPAGLSFEDSIGEKIFQEENFKKKLMNNELRILTSEERERVCVHFEEGRLLQIGLDNANDLNSVIPKGEYIFVLQKINDKKQLYLAKKELTTKGRIQHSSFFHSLSVKSAGMITIDDNGRISKLVMHSGHFLPTNENIPIIQKFISNKIPKDRLNFDISMPAGYIV